MFAVLWAVLSILQLSVVWLWAVRTFPAVARRRRWLAGAFVVLAAAHTAARWMVIHRHAGGALETVLIVLLMTLWIASLPLTVQLAASWIADRRARRAAAARAAGPTPAVARDDAAPAAPAPGVMSRRQVVEAASGLTFLGATGSMLGWGAVRGRHGFTLDEVAVRIAGLPRALDGYVIAQVSDLHAGAHVDEAMLREGLDRVREAKPDLLVLTGDLVDFDPAFGPMVARAIQRVVPRDGVYGILGNHDDYAGADTVLEVMRQAGITMLVNEGRLLRPADGGGLALLGVYDQWTYRYNRPGPDLDRALSMVPEPAPRILLSHQPPTVDRWAGRVALQLSGHTHGGQINPGFRPADFFFPYVSGRYEVGGTTLYVNRGFGTVGPPSRIGAPPEITRIVLVAA